MKRRVRIVYTATATVEDDRYLAPLICRAIRHFAAEPNNTAGCLPPLPGKTYRLRNNAHGYNPSFPGFTDVEVSQRIANRYYPSTWSDARGLLASWWEGLSYRIFGWRERKAEVPELEPEERNTPMIQLAMMQVEDPASMRLETREVEVRIDGTGTRLP